MVNEIKENIVKNKSFAFAVRVDQWLIVNDKWLMK